MTPGRFSFRFGGAAVDGNDQAYHLVGLGVLVLNPDGTVGGTQSSTITKLVGAGCQLVYTKNTLSGTFQFAGDGTGNATIVFTSANEVLTGTFDFVLAPDENRFWMISTGAKITSMQGILADEVVSGEAVRLA